jgi:fructose-1,6-bisphosphatase I
LYGGADKSNTSGDSVKKLDVISNEVFINILKSSNKVAVMCSEEDENLIEIDLKTQGN